MPCYHPLKALVKNGQDGKKRISFKRSEIAGQNDKVIVLPCGRCIGCKLERSRQWAVRLMHESQMHESSCFMTLTYNEESAPADGSLDKKMVQKFMKRLRLRISPVRVKFFLCGEYGEKLKRPHYHCVLFGYDFPDKEFTKMSLDGSYKMYESKLLNEVWGKGMCWISEVTFESARYVAGYCTKKITGKGAAAHYGGKQTEFLLLSRGGRSGKGISHGWYEQFKSDVFPADEVIVRGRSCKPPRYYMKKLRESAAAEFPPGEVTKQYEDVIASRECDADRLEGWERKGRQYRVMPSDNPFRLATKERVAAAQLRRKIRNLEV